MGTICLLQAASTPASPRQRATHRNLFAASGEHTRVAPPARHNGTETYLSLTHSTPTVLTHTTDDLEAPAQEQGGGDGGGGRRQSAAGAAIGGWFNKAKAAAITAHSKVKAATDPHMSKAKTFVDGHVANAKTEAIFAAESAQRDAIRNRGAARNGAAGIGNLFQKVGVKGVPFVVVDAELQVFYEKLERTERAVKGVVSHAELFELRAGALLTSLGTLKKVMSFGAAAPASAAHPGDDDGDVATVAPVFSVAASALRDSAVTYASICDDLNDDSAESGSTRALWKAELASRVLLPASQKLQLVVSQKSQIFEIEKKRRAVETLTEEVAFCSSAKSERIIAQKDEASQRLLSAQAAYVNERADLMLALQARFAEVADVVTPLVDEMRYCEALLLLSGAFT